MGPKFSPAGLTSRVWGFGIGSEPEVLNPAIPDQGRLRLCHAVNNVYHLHTQKNRTPCLGVLFATDIAIYGTVLSSFGFKNIGPSESPRTLEIQYRNPKPPKENPAAPLSHALSPVILELRSNYFVKPVQGLGLRA